MQIENWLGFCSIALLATATPGPAVLLVSVHCLSFGFKKSLATILGNITGLFIMSACSVAGLSAIVMHSVLTFTLIKIIGAIYLIYLGLKMWRNGIKHSGITAIDARQNTRDECRSVNLYGQGVMIALTNPKAIIFTTALLPQFLTLSEPLMPQFSILVVSFMLLSFACLSCYSLTALKMQANITTKAFGNAFGKISGSLFIGTGCFMLSQSR